MTVSWVWADALFIFICLLNIVNIFHITPTQTDIDQTKKLVFVSSGAFVAYDYLLMTPGLQPQSFPSFDEKGILGPYFV